MPARSIAFTAALMLLVLAAARETAHGAAFTVTRSDDPASDGCAVGDCSLREAVIVANEVPGADTIALGAGTFTLSLGVIEVTDALTLRGSTSDQTFIDGGGAGGVFLLTGDGVVMEDLTIRNGSAIFGGGVYVDGEATLRRVSVTDNEAAGVNGYGGGFFTTTGADLTILDSIVTSNEALYGGGLYGGGSVDIRRSTFISNTARDSGGGIDFSGHSLSIQDTQINGNLADGAGYGGGVFLDAPADTVYTVTNSAIFDNAAGGVYSGGLHNQGGGNLQLTNVTISGNDASGAGGMTNTGVGSAVLTNVTIAENVGGEFSAGLANYANLTLTNSIVVDDSAACTIGSGSWTSGGHNIDNDGSCQLTATGDMPLTDPMLVALADNGGITLTHALNAGSPAIDAAEDCPAVDQRGYARNVGACDIGAFEYGSTGPALIWGDNNCSGYADPVDALLALRHDAGLPADTGSCPEMGGPVVSSGPALTWGDIDCSGAVDPVDALKLLRHDAGLSVEQEPECPPIGEP